VSSASGLGVATAGWLRCRTALDRLLAGLGVCATDGAGFVAGTAGSAVLDDSVTDVSFRLRVSGRVRSDCCATLSLTGTRCSRPPEQADRAVIPASITLSCFIVPPEGKPQQFLILQSVVLCGGSPKGTALAPQLHARRCNSFEILHLQEGCRHNLPCLSRSPPYDAGNYQSV
jgi:hypothetical protein